MCHAGHVLFCCTCRCQHWDHVHGPLYGPSKICSISSLPTFMINAITVHPMPLQNNAAFAAAFTDIFNVLCARNYQPAFVRLASIRSRSTLELSFYILENLNNSQDFKFSQARSLQNIAHKFSYNLCKQSPHLPLSSSCD
jgi:hypothetical protein